jgi:chromosome segregation ATPase
MNDVDDDIAMAEAGWETTTPDIPETMPENGLTVKADQVFAAQILPISAIEKRRAELGVADAALCTREQKASLQTVNGLCRKVNGQIEKVRKFLVADAIRVQKVVNERAKDIKAEVALIQKPIVNRFAEWDAEDEAIEAARIAAEEAAVEADRKRAQEAEDAARKAQQAIEDAQRAEEVAKNRTDAERIAAERAILDAEKRAADKAAQEMRDQLAEERREFEARKAAIAKIEADRQQKIADDKAAEERAAQQEALAKAEEFQKQQAAEKERLRLEALEPDIPKLHRYAVALNLTRSHAPAIASEDAKQLLTWADQHLARVVSALLDFGTITKE